MRGRKDWAKKGKVKKERGYFSKSLAVYASDEKGSEKLPVPFFAAVAFWGLEDC